MVAANAKTNAKAGGHANTDTNTKSGSAASASSNAPASASRAAVRAPGSDASTSNPHDAGSGATRADDRAAATAEGWRTRVRAAVRRWWFGTPEPFLTKSTKALKADPRSFDSFAGDYDRFAGMCDPLGEWLAGLELSGGRALDAGCGSGRHAFALAAAYDEVVAADLSAPLIEVARMRRPHERVRYEIASLTDVHDAEGFDLVLSMTTLHHVHDLPAALAHLKSLVRPGGRIVLVDNTAAHPTPARRTYVRGAARELREELRRLSARDAWWLYRFRTGGAWLDHLMSDRYLSPSQFRRQYGRVFPGAEFSDLDFATAMQWTCPKD
jgi:2-polyprenyl-3-methyl-5-hydroxy-6-metoxy-1,4-benzoquinol methylase